MALLVVGAAIGIAAAITTGNSSIHRATVSTPSHSKSAGSSGSTNVNLDILSAQTQLTVRDLGKSIENSPTAIRSAAPSAGATVAFPRLGYVLGSNAAGYVSLTNDLQKVLHVWSLAQGMYPAAASNPSDVWLSSPYATPSHAQEFNMVEEAVAPAVPIPSGSIVLGQLGPVLIIQSAQPSAMLELWNSSARTIVAALGPFDQLAISSKSVAWTSANALKFATAFGVIDQQPSGPPSDWATALDFSPDGSMLATVWTPSPGSVHASSAASDEQYRSLSLMNVVSGQSITVPKSHGIVGPVTWNANGTRVFFAQRSPDATSVGIYTYGIGDPGIKKLDIPGLSLPRDFGPPLGPCSFGIVSAPCTSVGGNPSGRPLVASMGLPRPPRRLTGLRQFGMSSR